jgi:hypothetical protein
LLSLTVVAACALCIAVTALADSQPPNFTCDAAHHPADGAVYKNFTASTAYDCVVTDTSFSVQRNVEVDGGLELDDNAHLTVGQNVTIDGGLLNIGATTPNAPSSITVGGNVTDNGGDFNAMDRSGNGTSPVTVHIAGSFSGNEGYNILFEGFDVTIGGPSTITGDHSTVIFAEGDFGPVSIHEITDPLASAFVYIARIHGSVDLADNNDLFTDVDGNQIAGDLNCVGNAPAPSNQGIPNVVTGSETGQCTGL